MATRKGNLVQHKAHKGSGFTIIANEAIQDSFLSLKAKGLHHYLLSLPEDWNVSISGLSKCLKESDTAIRNALKELEGHGYLKRTRILPSETESRQIEYLYEVYELSQNTAFQHTENLHTESQSTESLPVENPLKNIKKEKELKNKNISTKTDKHTRQFNQTGYKDEFDKLWRRFPKKKGKDKALISYIRARKAGTSFTEVERGLTRFLQMLKDEGREARYIMDGVRWFTEHRWTDEYTDNDRYTADPFKNYQQRDWDLDALEKQAQEKALAPNKNTPGP